MRTPSHADGRNIKLVTVLVKDSENDIAAVDDTSREDVLMPQGADDYL